MRSEAPDTNILVWLPSPMGDAILCTPALRAIRERFRSARIWFLANKVVRDTLSPGAFNDEWIENETRNPFKISARLRQHRFSHAILFKNSVTPAMAVFMAGIPKRVGYVRRMRGFLLTDKLHPPRIASRRFKPHPMIDYYLAVASRLGADAADRSLDLPVEQAAREQLRSKLPELAAGGPVVVLVPGGAFGASKCWPADRFAQTADRLMLDWNATVVISVAPEPGERKIAEAICDSSSHRLVNLGRRPVSIAELKALFSIADLVITNDTGPRHMAIALGRKVITLFGPNDPAWTQTGCQNEIQIVGNVLCAPCGRPNCAENEHLCMRAITVDAVCDAARQLLEGNRTNATITARQRFLEVSESSFIDTEYESGLRNLGLTSVCAVFSFDRATNLSKSNLAGFRSRFQFEIDAPTSGRRTTVFMKRYERPPISLQIKNWLGARGRRSCAKIEFETASRLKEYGINTPKTLCYGEQWGRIFEKRSFIITEKLPDAESLERRLPDCFTDSPTAERLKSKRDFIGRLAEFVRRFHKTGYCHRDLYFSHIFHGNVNRFYLIDLARAFKPILLHRRFRIKDIAQLHFSAPGSRFSSTDRMRFYLRYAKCDRLTERDKVFIRKVMSKARRMAKHEIKHGRDVPFEN